MPLPVPEPIAFAAAAACFASACACRALIQVRLDWIFLRASAAVRFPFSLLAAPLGDRDDFLDFTLS